MKILSNTSSSINAIRYFLKFPDRISFIVSFIELKFVEDIIWKVFHVETSNLVEFGFSEKLHLLSLPFTHHLFHSTLLPNELFIFNFREGMSKFAILWLHDTYSPQKESTVR